VSVSLTTAGPSPLLLSVPVAVGYVPLGAVFGFLFVQAGGPWWLAIASSIWVYAGASQFMMIPMLSAGLSVGSIALATLVVNLRHVFYGLSLLHALPQHPIAKAYMVFGLTDETYSVLTTLPPETSTAQRVWLTLINQLWWVSGTAIGALLGSQAQTQLAGLDFALVALFAVLVVEQWRARSSPKPLWVALAAYPVAWLVAPQQALLLSIALSVGAAIMLDWISHER